jgi:antitoxin MazE
MQKLAKTVELKLVAIGNSRGVRLPKTLIERYGIRDVLLIEEHAEGLLLRGKKDRRLGWEDTYKDMARQHEDWGGFDTAIADGLEPRDKW